MGGASIILQDHKAHIVSLEERSKFFNVAVVSCAGIAFERTPPAEANIEFAVIRQLCLILAHKIFVGLHACKTGEILITFHYATNRIKIENDLVCLLEQCVTMVVEHGDEGRRW